MYLSIGFNPAIYTLDANGTEVNTTVDLTDQFIRDNGIRNVTLYRVHYSELFNKNPFLFQVNFWIYSVIIKLIPCIALTVLSLRLIGALLEAKRRRKLLTGNAVQLKKIANGHEDEEDTKVLTKKNKKSNKALEKEKQTDRTTRMLLAVLLLFLLTEFPQVRFFS